MKSFSLLRTNTGLTTNLKIIVDSNYGLYMESIDSDPQLSLSKFKKIGFTKDNFFDEMIPFFYGNLETITAFSVLYNNDNDHIATKYSDQYDDTYQMGARNIIDNKNYQEDYEFFAPIYFNKGNFPKYFAIFRVDGPGLIQLSSSNFRNEILNNLKCVKIFDITKNTDLGEWVDKNFISNTLFPDTPLDFDYRNDTFTNWYGINYQSGGYTYQSKFLNDNIENENALYDLEKFIFDGYSTNGIVFPNIINFSFLFNDTPATPTTLRNWSINRYFGFYIENMDLVTSISPYSPPPLKSDIYMDPLSKNTLRTTSSTYPFADNKSEDTFNDRVYYIEYLGNFYQVQQFTITSNSSEIVKVPSITTNTFVETFTTVQEYRYRIICDFDLTNVNVNLFNQNICTFDSNNYIIKYDNTNYTISNFNEADVWLININGNYHNITNSNGNLQINTDYGFNFTSNDYTYYVNSSGVNSASYSTTVNLITGSSSPVMFNIYKLNFTDIKDFDTMVVDTQYSKYEYELYDQVTNTDESKLYFPNLNGNSTPPDLDDFSYKGSVVNIPTSSEYTANLETFRVENSDSGSPVLSELWRKNPIHCRWGYQNSLSANDYPYLLNNSSLFEDMNKTVNPFLPIPSRSERNLDYFYTINSSTSSYIHHSLHVENNLSDGTLDPNFNFNLSYYLNTGIYNSATYSYDYFTYLFSKTSMFQNGEIIQNTKKYSEFNAGNNDIPNITLFRGIKFSIYDINNISYDSSGNLTNIGLQYSNTFENYKFSILASNNNNTGNQLSWVIIDEWDSREIYATNSIVVHDDILYQAIAQNGPVSQINNSFLAPYNYPSYWTASITYNYNYSLLWNPSMTASYSLNDPNYYILPSIVYNNGEYYQYIGNGSIDFWNPYTTYGTQSIVLYKGNFWQSTTASNITRPSTVTKSKVSDTNYWTKISPQYQNCNWQLIELWNQNTNYNVGDYVVYNNVVYVSPNLNQQQGNIPNVIYGNYSDTNWEWMASIQPDINVPYSTSTNPLILMDDKYYLSIYSGSESYYLNNGITIYINHMYQNILINISINDNTITNLSNSDRDSLYGAPLYQSGVVYGENGLPCGINTKLTANNFINAINDLKNNYGFINNLTYYIINTDGSTASYSYPNSGLLGLPHIIKCDFPDEFKMTVESLQPQTITSPNIKPNSVLNDGVINDISQLNHHNNLPLAYSLYKNQQFQTDKTKPERIVSNNISGIQNIIDRSIYRHSGYYMPVFYEVELFQRPGLTTSVYGNYIFDTSLTNFGIMKQRIVSKVNINGSILKLSNRTDVKSIYPMLDEFGYTTFDFFIFKSTWDLQYHVQCVNNVNTGNSATNDIINVIKNAPPKLF